MINLVFMHALAEPAVGRRMDMLGKRIADLRANAAVAAIGRKCPTRWVYAVDALNYVLRRCKAINIFRDHFSQPPISDSLTVLDWIFLPFKFASLRVEARDCKLYDVMPIAREAARQLRAIRGLRHGDEGLAILDTVTAHFFAKLKTNAFNAIVTA
jgi:hypothetical protein